MSVDASLIENVTQDKNRTMISVSVNLKNEFKKLIKHHACEEDYAWNPSTCLRMWQVFWHWRILERLWALMI